MQTTNRRPKLRRLAGTRRGAALIAITAAIAAGAVLLVLMSSYKDSVQSGTIDHSVLVADRLIPKGTQGAVVLGDDYFRPQTVQEERLEPGALTQAAALKGQVAVRDILPGEQLTAADFAAGADPLRAQLRGLERAIAVPIDNAHGLIGTARVGDRMDVIGGVVGASGTSGRTRSELRMIARDILVLKAADPDKNASADRSEVLTVRMTAKQAAQVALMADVGKVWFILRPPAGAEDSDAPVATLDTLLTGLPAVEVNR